jgi:alginate O-acetyltransferase complex protein AlgI
VIIQLNWHFWFCAVAIFVAIRLRPFRSSAWFGLLNLAALVLLIGARGALLIALVTICLWLALVVAGKLGDGLAGSLLSVSAILAIIGILLFQKITYEALLTSTSRAGPDAVALRLLELISFSYVALRAWDVVVAVRGGDRLLDPLALSGYIAPFFMMPAGPINVYRDHLDVDKNGFPAPRWSEYIDGLQLIVTGLFFKFVIAELIRLWVVGANGDWSERSYADSIITFIYVYFDFAGYSLVALGIGRLLKVPTPVNFDRPFTSPSLTDFWLRWHASLGLWIRRNVYFPSQLAMLRRTDGEHPYLVNTLSLVVAFTFVGVWHRITPQFVVWGILFGCLVAAERYVRDTWLLPMRKHRPWLSFVGRTLGPVYVLVAVTGLLYLTAIGQVVGAGNK